MKIVPEGKIIAHVCVIEAAKYKDITVGTKSFYPRSVCEITEYMLINKSVEDINIRKLELMRLNSLY